MGSEIDADYGPTGTIRIITCNTIDVWMSWTEINFFKSKSKKENIMFFEMEECRANKNWVPFTNNNYSKTEVIKKC